MRSEEQLGTVLIDLRVCKEPDYIAEKLRMQLCIQFINDYQTSLLQGHQDNRQRCEQLSGSIGLAGKRELIECIMQRPLQVKFIALLIKTVPGDANPHVVHHGKELLL